jgi:hypothetical protein
MIIVFIRASVTLFGFGCVAHLYRSFPAPHIVMIHHNQINDADLRRKILQHEICFGGNKKLSIYGTLRCKSGKRMKKENRVFFMSEKEAIESGYRPCGNCVKTAFKNWNT